MKNCPGMWKINRVIFAGSRLGKSLSQSTATTIVVDSIFSTDPSKDISKNFIELEDRYSAHNYHPLPVVLSRGSGVHVWDVNDKVLLIFHTYKLFVIK
jgi:hypothetical protein